jgi:hypothetical protein
MLVIIPTPGENNLAVRAVGDIPYAVGVYEWFTDGSPRCNIPAPGGAVGAARQRRASIRAKGGLKATDHTQLT